MSPNDNQLGRSQCQIIEGVSRNKALLFLAMALFTALLGFLFFGTDKALQARIDRDELDDIDDDARDDERSDRDEKRPGRRSSVLAGRGERERLEDDERDEPKPRARPMRSRRLGDEDEPPEDRDRVRRTRRLDDEDDEDDEPREPRRRTGGRYDDAFDSVRD